MASARPSDPRTQGAGIVGLFRLPRTPERAASGAARCVRTLLKHVLRAAGPRRRAPEQGGATAVIPGRPSPARFPAARQSRALDTAHMARPILSPSSIHFHRARRARPLDRRVRNMTSDTKTMQGPLSTQTARPCCAHVEHTSNTGWKDVRWPDKRICLAAGDGRLRQTNKHPWIDCLRGSLMPRAPGTLPDPLTRRRALRIALLRGVWLARDGGSQAPPIQIQSLINVMSTSRKDRETGFGPKRQSPEGNAYAGVARAAFYEHFASTSAKRSIRTPAFATTRSSRRKPCI
jgi:hypothetical protein